MTLTDTDREDLFELAARTAVDVPATAAALTQWVGEAPNRRDLKARVWAFEAAIERTATGAEALDFARRSYAAGIVD